MNKRFPILDYLPKNFPSKIYEEISDKILKYKDNFELQYNQFAGGWRSIVYRYLACNKHSSDYIKIVKKYRISPSQPFRYDQERELFNFFTNGLSIFECFGYSFYMICSIINQNKFKVRKNEEVLKNIILTNTISKLEKYYLEENITKELRKLINSQEYKDWNKVRNILIHRETRGRIFRVGTGSAKIERSALWFKGIAIDKQTTVCRLNWLELNLFTLIELTYDFTNKFI